MQKITLIGGAPVSGKTTMSRNIAKTEGGVELSSDSIRSWMKQLVNPDNYPGLFYSDGMTAEEFYQRYNTPQAVVDGEIAEGIQVEKGILSLLQTSITWEHLILEGIAITPEFMSKVITLYPDSKVETIVLVDMNIQSISDRISSRGLWGPLDTYPSNIIPKEVEWVILYNQWFTEQAKKFDLKIKYS